MWRASGEILSQNVLKSSHQLVYCKGVLPQDFKDASLANLYKRNGNRHSRDNHRGTALLSIASKILARFMLSRLINQHATILDEKCWEFCTFVPQNAYPVDLVPLWRLPPHYPGQCCSDGLRNDPATFFWRERGVFAVASAFRSFIFKLDKATCIFLNIFFPKLNTEQSLLPERQCDFRASEGTVGMIFAPGHGSISTNTMTSLPHLLTWPRRSTRLVVMAYAKLCQSLDVPHFHHHC